MNVISIFFASLVMASAIAIGTVDNGDVNVNGEPTETVNTVPPSTEEITVSGQE